MKQAYKFLAVLVHQREAGAVPPKNRNTAVNRGFDEKVIEEFVDKIIVHKDYFEWKLNFMNETIKLEISGKSKSDCFVVEYKEK